MDIITFLERSKDVRKIFGKRELVIIRKQMRGVALTQSEKNRLSRDIRKKLRFIQEFSRHAFDVELKKGSEIKETIEDIQKEMLESEYAKKVKKIYLFGSTAEGKQRLDSDIDIAVEFDETNIKEATKFRIKFNYDKNVDVQVYNILPEKIKKQIDLHGKTVYQRKN